MKIFIPADKKQEFIQLSAEYQALQKELEVNPTPERHAEISERISAISKRYELGLWETTGFEK